MRLYNHKSQTEFQAWVRKFFEDFILEKLQDKGGQYAGGALPAMNNFIKGGHVTRQSPQSYLMGLATKHWLALSEWATGTPVMASGEDPDLGDAEADTAIERASDILIYMFLLIFWLSGGTKPKDGQK